MLAQVLIEPVEVQLEILYPATTKLDIGVAEPVRDRWLVFPSQLQHRFVEVDTDYPTAGPHDLSGDEADLSAARTQIEDCISRLDMA